MLRGDGEHAREAQPRELLRPLLGTLDLVDDYHHLLAPSAQAGGDGLVVRKQPGPAVHHEQDEVRLVDGQLRLSGGGSQQGIVRLQEQPAGVDHLEGGPLPGGLRVVPVAGGARPAVGNGFPAAADPVEKSRLAHVGPAHQRDFWYRDHL